MTTGNNWTSTGLMFFEYREFDIVDVANRLMSNLEALDQVVTNVYIVSEQCTLVTTADYQLRLGLDQEASFPAFRPRVKTYVSLAIRDLEGKTHSERSKKAVLAKSLKTLHRTMQPNYVKWIGDDVFVSSADFVRATRSTRARPAARKKIQRAASAARRVLPAVEDANDLLQAQLIKRQARKTRNMQLAHRPRPALDKAEARQIADINNAIREDSMVLRLSAWLLSIAAALIALPVGAALLLFNLLRGENLRLASRTAAVTGTFVAFQALGTTAQAMTTIQGILR